jgi:hypothetical protein
MTNTTTKAKGAWALTNPSLAQQEAILAISAGRTPKSGIATIKGLLKRGLIAATGTGYKLTPDGTTSAVLIKKWC